MRNFYALLLSLLISAGAFAQVSGTITDGETGEPLVGATVLVKGTTQGTVTNFDGDFALKGLSDGSHDLVMTYIGYTEQEMNVTVSGGKADVGEVKLASSAIGLSAVQVIASVAVDRKTPVAVSTIKAEQIEAKLGNQEFPEILKSTPSIYTTKQGGGFGDARINVRGFSQENVALLINGLSVSGMEDNKVYWSNWAGLGDVTRTIQVQRGLGASRMAISSVGGTINIITKTTDQEKGGNFFSSIGNDGYKKTGVTLSTGRTENGWAFTFSGSRTTGDGYIEGTYIDAWSYFLSVAKEIGTNQQLLFTVFGAPQRHGQRDFFHPIDDQRDVYGTKWNDDFGYYKGEKFLFRDNFYHKPQASLNHIWDINEKTNLITALYGSVGRGGGTGDIGTAREFLIQHDSYGNQQFDQIARYNAGLSNEIGLTDFPDLTYEMAGGSSGSGRIISATNGGIIKRASMNEHEWYGLLSNLSHDLSDNLTLTGGIDFRFYTGSHYRKTIDLLGGDYWFDDDNINNKTDWVDLNADGIKDANEYGVLVRPTNDASSFFGSVPDDQKIDYYNDEDINWYGLFAQLEYSKGPLSAFLSGAYNATQMRRYDFFLKTPGNQVTDWLNFSGGNAKIGANYNIDDNHNVFVNAGYISRAPYFDALFPTFNNDEPNENPVNEKVVAFELGYGLRTTGFAANLNAYYTDWSDKTESLSSRDAGGQIFFASLLGVDANHSGVELDFNARITSNIKLTGFAGINNWEWKNDPNGTITDENQNVLGEATYYIDGLKVGGSAQTTLGLGTDINLGNGLTFNLQWFGFDNLYANYNPSNRSNPDLKGIQALELPSYSLVDAGFAWKFKFAGLDARANVNINNLFDEEYIAEAQDRYRAGDSTDKLISDTSGWYGFGRTWNAGLKIFF
ncbi:MAG: TonB-dependent receptor [Chitinophagales bacterium]